ncbi:aromatic motif membrane protein [Mycoplasma nasistruthionis]|uniref:Lipoprotein n=1 Tax=Mycoplasma nasistruthionis TaxID=353852 RepID=A0A4Y6I685_9MOLU|nr:aromatic motif membrane protein [Mycoplasma nasistruthionis]QDF64810.1 hypothetical protein FIV53_00575 [Mycoplasma nasistruthionis]
MKKLLKLSAFIPLASIFTLVSCNQPIVPETTNYKLKTKQKSLNQELLDKIVKEHYLPTDNFAAKAYINNQNSIDDGIYVELKSSLIFASIINSDVLANSGPKRVLVGKGINAISNTLNNDWYFYLNNLNKFNYILNPFGSRYIDSNVDQDEQQQKINPKSTQAQFEYVNSKYNSANLELKNPKILSITEKTLTNQKADIYNNKSVMYLNIENNYIIPVFKYQADNNSATKLFVSPDIIWKQNPDLSIENLINQFHDAFQNSWSELLKKEYDYNVEIESSDPDIVYSQFNDENLFKLYKNNNYNEITSLAIAKLNQDQLNAFRYTWGYVYEN